MRGHLEHAVGGSVDDRLAGAHVFLAQFLDDLGAGRRAIAERAAPDAALELLHDFGRKAVRVKREWLREMDAHHFPMAGGGVFAGRSQRAASEGAGRASGGVNVRQAA